MQKAATGQVNDFSTNNIFEDRFEQGNAYLHSGDAHCGVGDFKKAIIYYERFLEIAKELGERSGEASAYCKLGNAHHGLGDYKTAINYHERHLKIAEELGDTLGEGKAYCNLGIAYHSLGSLETAIDYYKRHLKVAKEWGYKRGEGGAYGNLGLAFFSLGDFKTAIDYHERHLKIAQELGDRSGEGRAYGNLGNDHSRLGDFKTAIDCHERLLNILKEMGDRLGEGRAYGSLGNEHSNLGDFETAIKYYELHLKIAIEFGNILEEKNAYCNLGIAHQTLGDLKTAIDYYERYLKIAKDLGDRSGEGGAYGNLGNVHSLLGDSKTAIDYHERHLKIAKELGDRSGEGGAYGNLGNQYHNLGDFKTAIEYLKRHLEIAKESGNSLEEGLASSNLGGSFELLGQVPVAIEYYEHSITLLNSVRERLQSNDEWKISFRHQYWSAYRALVRLLLAEGNVTKALFSAEQARAQGLKDLLQLNYAFERNDARSGTETTSFDDLLSYLPTNTIFISFGKGELNFWVCQKGKGVECRKKQFTSRCKVKKFFHALSQGLQQEIGTRNLLKCEDRSLELARDESLVAKRSPQDDRQTQELDLQKSALSTLYDTIIEPIQDLLLGSELIFVPEGPLCLAPFAAFKDPDSKYLCESFKIRVAPSLTSLKMIADCPLDYHHNTGALLVGDPLTELSPLPCAREEVEMIGKMLNSTPLIGTQATKDEVLRRLGSVALVHMAAHGNMETGDIALASNEGVKKDILTMRDVLRVQIRARLVVLSCCHSARGEIKAEGVVGIARAFLGAGARSVLVSLWAIDDEATLEFMKNFYQHVVKGRSASEALNQAMNCMRESEEFSAIKFWAPFVLIGDDVKLEFSGSK